MTDNETREIKRCYGNVENQVDEILARIETMDKQEINTRLKVATLSLKKMRYCLYGWNDEKTKIIQHNEALEELFSYVDERLVNAYCCFIEDENLTDNDNVRFYSKCCALAIFNMLLDIEDCMKEYTCAEYGQVIELRKIGTIASHLVMIEGIVKSYKKTLQLIGIDREKVSEELYLAISKLENFLWEHIPPIKNQGAINGY